MYGVFLAKSLDAVTIAFGTHVTPMASETLRSFPALDYVLRGEPELTLRELVDTYEVSRGRWIVTEEGRLLGNQSGQEPQRHPLLWKMWRDSDPDWQPAWTYTDRESKNDKAHTSFGSQTPDLSTGLQTFRAPLSIQLAQIKGLGWRNGGQFLINQDRPFICNLDDLPIPYHRLLPIDRYQAPLIKGPYTFIVTSRGCPAGCKFCIKHVSYQYSVRLRSPSY